MASKKVVKHRGASKQVVKHNKALLPGWALIACGILFVVGSVLLVLAGEALLTSRQVSVGQLQDSLQSQEALHNDLSTQVGLLSQPGNLLSSALSSSSKLSGSGSHSQAVAASHGAQIPGGNPSHRYTGKPPKNSKPSSNQFLAAASDGRIQKVSTGTGG